MKTLIATLSVLLALGVGAQAAEQHKRGAAPAASADWLTDHDAAFKRARQDGRHVLMLFTGSDWCGLCKALKAEVFNTTEFRSFAQRNLVLLEIDFPRNKRQPEALRRQNERLAREWEVDAYPTVAVMTPAGKVLGGIGYEQGGVKPWLAKLEKILKKG